MALSLKLVQPVLESQMLRLQEVSALFHDFFRKAETLGDGHRVASTGNAHRELVGGFKSVGVKLEAAISGVRIALGEGGDIAVMGRHNCRDSELGKMPDDCLCQGRTFLRVGAVAKLVQQYQSARRCVLQNLDDVADMGAESRDGIRDALLVSDVGEHAIEHRESAPFLGGDVDAGLVHQR